VTGVWVGNADNSAMDRVSGSTGAAPIWHNFMEEALGGVPATQFPRPQGIDEIEISADAGSLPSDACPPDRRRWEIFAAGQGPLGPDHDFHQLVRIDASTNALATEYCPVNVVEERYFYVLPGAEGARWAQEHGIAQPPLDLCPVHTGAADVALSEPRAGQPVAREVQVVGRTLVPGFDHYIVEYGEGQDPIGWGHVAGPVGVPVDGGLLAVWNVRDLDNRDYTLRVVAFDQAGNDFEARTWVWVENPEATPTWLPTLTVIPTGTRTTTPTTTATSTSLPTATVPTDTPQPTDTAVPTVPSPPTDTPTATATSLPTDTATPSPSPVPTDTPMPTATPEPSETPTSTATATPVDTSTPTATLAPTDLPQPTAPPVITETLTLTPTLLGWTPTVTVTVDSAP
jgi:hypothetical protein